MKIEFPLPIRTSYVRVTVLVLCVISIWIQSVFHIYLLQIFVAVIALTSAIALPIFLKRFSLYSLLLFVIGVLFLASAAIGNAYDTIVRQLPIMSQIEFSKIMQPQQVSYGLSQTGFGLVFLAITLAVFLVKKLPEESTQKKKRLYFLLIGSSATIFLLTMGTTSIIKGLGKL